MRIKREITRERYEELENMTLQQQREAIAPTLLREWVCGRGYYGHVLAAENGKYYICHEVGDSCD